MSQIVEENKGVWVQKIQDCDRYIERYLDRCIQDCDRYVQECERYVKENVSIERIKKVQADIKQCIDDIKYIREWIHYSKEYISYFEYMDNDDTETQEIQDMKEKGMVDLYQQRWLDFKTRLSRDPEETCKEE
jgi:hypothetical protein